MIINLTPHTINVNDGRSFPPSGQVARVTVSHLQVGMVDGIAIYQPTYGELVGLPDPVDGTVYLVSGQVAAAAKRADVVAPATYGELVGRPDPVGGTVYLVSGQVARVTVSHLQVGMVDGIAIYQPTYGELVGLPDPVDGTVYLVSGQVAAAAKRADVVAPATGYGAAIRKDGQTVFVPGFSRG